jgi:uncharacterized membrane protein YgcG
MYLIKRCLYSYLDKEGVLDVFSSAVAVLSDDKTDLLKRLRYYTFICLGKERVHQIIVFRYAKDMLQQLLKSNSSSGSSSNGSTGYTCTGNSNNGGNGNGSSNSGGGKSS